MPIPLFDIYPDVVEFGTVCTQALTFHAGPLIKKMVISPHCLLDSTTALPVSGMGTCVLNVICPDFRVENHDDTVTTMVHLWGMNEMELSKQISELLTDIECTANLVLGIESGDWVDVGYDFMCPTSHNVVVHSTSYIVDSGAEMTISTYGDPDPARLLDASILELEHGHMFHDHD